LESVNEIEFVKEYIHPIYGMDGISPIFQSESQLIIVIGCTHMRNKIAASPELIQSDLSDLSDLFMEKVYEEILNNWTIARAADEAAKEDEEDEED
jgi:hypothetical protein